MTRLGHVLLAWSLLMGPQTFAQTVTPPVPADKATINTFTASTGSKVHDIVAPTKNPVLPALNDTTSLVKTLVTPQEDERRYTMAVEDARARIGGVLSLPLGENGTIMGLGNNPNWWAALIIKGNLNTNDTDGKTKGKGVWEVGAADKTVSFSIKYTY